MTFWAGYETNKTVSCTAPIETVNPNVGQREGQRSLRLGSVTYSVYADQQIDQRCGQIDKTVLEMHKRQLGSSRLRIPSGRHG